MGLVLVLLWAVSRRTGGWLPVVGAVFLTVVFLVYAWWTVRPNVEGGYQWSPLQRLGVFAEGSAFGLVAVRLSWVEAPGPVWAWVLAAFLMFVIVRPVIDEIALHDDDSGSSPPSTKQE